MTDDLQRIGHAAGHNACVGDGGPAGNDARHGRSFEDEHKYTVNYGAGGKLDERKAHTVQIFDDVFDADDLRGEAKGTGEGVHIALVDAEGLVNADKVHADGGDAHAKCLQQRDGAAVDNKA